MNDELKKAVQENPEPIKDSGFLKSCIAKISVKLDAALIVSAKSSKKCRLQSVTAA